MSNLKKDAIKNMDIRTILGDQLAYVSKKWMMDKGYSTKVTVVRAMVFIGSVLYIVGLVLTDISYTLVDPRVRFEK